MVYGDKNSTFVGVVSSVRSDIKVAHIESVLRSFDRYMPREINRLLTYILVIPVCSTQTAFKNLETEHIFGKVFYRDISVKIVKEAVALASKSVILNDLWLVPKSYVLFTIHRAENTDSDYNLLSVIHAFEILSKEEREIKIVFSNIQ